MACTYEIHRSHICKCLVALFFANDDIPIGLLGGWRQAADYILNNKKARSHMCRKGQKDDDDD